MDPLEYLDVARRLAQPGADEASLRTAVSRIYMALHQHAVLVMTERGILPTVRSVRDHMTAITLLRARPGYRLLGELLDALRRLRVHADEELSRPLTYTEAQRALTLADLALARVNAMRR